MSFWRLAWSPARTLVRSKNWQPQPKRRQKWHVYPFIPPQFLCLISADIPECKPDQPNLTGGNKFDKAKTTGMQQNRPSPIERSCRLSAIATDAPQQTAMQPQACRRPEDLARP